MKRLKEQTKVTQVSHVIVERPELVQEKEEPPWQLLARINDWEQQEQETLAALKKVIDELLAQDPEVKRLQSPGVSVQMIDECDCSPALAEAQGSHVHLQGEALPFVQAKLKNEGGPFYPITGMLRGNAVENSVEIYDGEKWLPTGMKLDDPDVRVQPVGLRSIPWFPTAGGA